MNLHGTSGPNRPNTVGPSRRAIRYILLAVAALLASACATTGSTLGSGVGDRFFDEAPYYAGRFTTVDPERIAHLPIVFQAGATQPAFFEPESGEGSALGILLEEMNRYLDGLGMSMASTAGPIAGETPPDVRFGCEPVGFQDCDSDSDDIAVQGKPWMLLAVGRPSPGWIGEVATALAEEGRELALVVTLEIGQYWTHQKNLLGSKEVRLGTGHSQDVPWLTSLDQPVQVLQLTGALMTPDGKAVRIGAEGLVARRTNIVLSGFGAQRLISDETVRELRESRREDLPGSPLVWEVALRNLVSGLVGER